MKYRIEREIPKVGTVKGELRQAAAISSQVLGQLGSEIQRQESFLTADKMFDVGLAEHEAIIRKPADLSGFPAARITEIGKTVDPTTAV